MERNETLARGAALVYGDGVPGAESVPSGEV
jgi:hypothetical protein